MQIIISWRGGCICRSLFAGGKNVHTDVRTWAVGGWMGPPPGSRGCRPNPIARTQTQTPMASWAVAAAALSAHSGDSVIARLPGAELRRLLVRLCWVSTSTCCAAVCMHARVCLLPSCLNAAATHPVPPRPPACATRDIDGLWALWRIFAGQSGSRACGHTVRARSTTGCSRR
jgi:hypothetical protein